MPGLQKPNIPPKPPIPITPTNPTTSPQLPVLNKPKILPKPSSPSPHLSPKQALLPPNNAKGRAEESKPVEIKLDSIPEPSQTWYHQMTSREGAEQLLLSAKFNYDGRWLIRQRSEASVSRPFVLSINHGSKVYHLEIRCGNNGGLAVGRAYKEGEPIFSTLEELVEYYKRKPLHLLSRSNPTQVSATVCLIQPCPRP